MKIGKCLKIAMAQHEMSTKDVAEKTELSVARIGAIKNSDDCHTDTLEKLAGIFDLKVSEFIALAE